MNVKIEKSWENVLAAEFEKQYFKDLMDFVDNEYNKNNPPIYPNKNDIFKAFNKTPFNSVRVVIIGQDPYHGPGEAQGFSFSVPVGVTIPASLRNIFKEIKNDVGQTVLMSGDLTDWTNQGVLLLNSVLTVPNDTPAGHTGKGWEQFTDAVIEALDTHRDGIVYLLWGAYAKEKGKKINRSRNEVLESGHPSFAHLHKTFFGNNHFSRTNKYLASIGREKIRW